MHLMTFVLRAAALGPNLTRDFSLETDSLGDSVVLEADVLGEAAHLAGDPLHALLALHHRHVDVVHALNHVVQWRS